MLTRILSLERFEVAHFVSDLLRRELPRLKTKLLSNCTISVISHSSLYWTMGVCFLVHIELN